MKFDPKVLLVEDHDIVAIAVETLLLENFSKAVIQKSGSFLKALKMLELGPLMDLIILDVDVPGGDSYRMIERLRKVQPQVRILVFTGQDERQHAIRFLKAGANGFLSKTAALEECAVAVKMILNGKKYVSEVVQQTITNSFFHKSPITENHGESSLSPRENEVLDLLLQGKWTKEIADELNLNPTTVSTHKSRIFQKMEVSNVIDLFKKINAL